MNRRPALRLLAVKPTRSKQRYRPPRGSRHVVVDAIQQISLGDITPRMARDSGFIGVVDLLKTAKHGRGQNVYLVTFHYETR